MLFLPGESIRLIKKGRKQTTQDVTVVNETNKIITVNTGKYLETVNKFEIRTGEIKVIRLQSKEDGMMQKEGAKITQEQLLYECRIKGTNKVALTAIGEKYGLTYLTAYTYYRNWKIKEKLQEEKSKIESESLEDFKNALTADDDQSAEKEEAEIHEEDTPNNTCDVLPVKESEEVVRATDNRQLLKAVTTYSGGFAEYIVKDDLVVIKKAGYSIDGIKIHVDQMELFIAELNELSETIIGR